MSVCECAIHCEVVVIVSICNSNLLVSSLTHIRDPAMMQMHTSCTIKALCGTVVYLTRWEWLQQYWSS
jgi:hypothetical protein